MGTASDIRKLAATSDVSASTAMSDDPSSSSESRDCETTIRRLAATSEDTISGSATFALLSLGLLVAAFLLRRFWMPSRPQKPDSTEPDDPIEVCPRDSSNEFEDSKGMSLV